MSNNHAVWPDLVLASLMMVAGLLMLRYRVWHLVHHHEVVTPLLAGSGAVALGVLPKKARLLLCATCKAAMEQPRSSQSEYARMER